MKASYLICGLYVLINLAATDERNFRIYFDDFVIKYKVPDIFEKVDSYVVQLNNRSYANIEMVLKRDLADVKVRAIMDFWKPNNPKKIRFYDIRLDACALLQTFHKNKLLNSYMKSFKKHANIILLCPFKANFTYKWSNWFVDEQDLPPFLFLGKFRTITEYFTLGRYIARVVVHGEVLPTQ
ncbi:uncharacterized protein LOC108092601 [Drosophila ficusphila]|uniref:uncharacterized protein LOC108092601 n=1 Tax=Drosophila ficusphila TaxID=30025 RepID=UPI001C8AB14F|nr:uncharacterized protein LOC108092601 [Drosophila ficusphila]